HETLLAYLVRRLLENGANTSFVNRIADDTISLDELVADPVAVVERMHKAEGTLGLPHPRIPQPRTLYGKSRANSAGIDLSNEHRLASLSSALLAGTSDVLRADPLLGVEVDRGDAKSEPVLNPADLRDVVGQVSEATPAEIEAALTAAVNVAPIWQATPPEVRAAALERAADLMEAQMQSLMGIIMREAGKTFANAIAEVREAVDFLRYYAVQVRETFSNDTHRPLGPVACISPWNFPLAIFTGQVAAALAAGNPVLAKPAEQTPLIAAAAVRLLRDAGVPAGAVQLLPGRGETVGAALVGDARVKGVMFTGSTEVARLLQRNVAGRLDAAGRPIPLIAETGGQNAMIVDSSALAEQVVGDVVSSAFDSAGQRCSALRVLCLQEDVADRILEMLKGAMQELTMANPDRLSTDVGPVIDEEARANIVRHIDAMRAKGRRVHQADPGAAQSAACRNGTFVPPTLIELDSIEELKREVFGPVLHVVRYPRAALDTMIGQINGTGYGLTLGIHTRIDETIAHIVDRAHVGNLYVNRNIVGAVVGVQPFGGEGLSGTGPKAGGPLYLFKLLASYPLNAPLNAIRLSGREVDGAKGPSTRIGALREWAVANVPEIASTCDEFSRDSPVGLSVTLPGPTGEENRYSVSAKAAVLCLAQTRSDMLRQLAAVLAIGARAIWVDSVGVRSLYEGLPAHVRSGIEIVADWRVADLFQAVIHHGNSQELKAIGRRVAEIDGPIIGIQSLAEGSAEISLDKLVVEHALSINTAAAGGNASLMTIG
uniref:L-glutamate gamma-semialdehyde dehydrogenase n=1 Tax=Cupriavidus sp. amp6 TaxID=388051 RepID=UPI00048E3BCD